MKEIAFIALVLASSALADDSATLQGYLNTDGTIPPGVYRVSQPIVVNLTQGLVEAVGVTILPIGNFAEVLLLGPGSNTLRIDGLKIDTTGTSTSAVVLNNATAVTFSNCNFVGTLDQSVVFVQGQIVKFINCRFEQENPNGVALTFDGYSVPSFGHSVSESQFSGAGSGISEIDDQADGGANEVQGLRIEDNLFVNVGIYSINITRGYATGIHGNAIDQAQNGILISGLVDVLDISGNQWIAGVEFPISVLPSDGGQFIIANNQFFGGNCSIAIRASATEHLNSISITGNNFYGESAALYLDSIFRCNVTGNLDGGLGSPSVTIVQTYSKSAPNQPVYQFSGNMFH